MPLAGDSIISIEMDTLSDYMDTLSDYIWRTSDQIFYIDSSCRVESNGRVPSGGWLTVTCVLTACTPGSAPGPTPSIEHVKAFTFFWSTVGCESLRASRGSCYVHNVLRPMLFRWRYMQLFHTAGKFCENRLLHVASVPVLDVSAGVFLFPK